ncbi:MAG: response regulator [Gammaproteobacteria bacterium]|nr:response regulator [Gammaproteobacteria bacterium]
MEAWPPFPPFPPSRLRETQLLLARVGAMSGLVIAALALFGWLSGIQLLTTLIPRGAVMQANTALAVLLLGAALWTAQWVEGCGCAHEEPSLAVLVFALPAGVLALLTLVEFVAARPLGLGSLLAIGPLRQPSGMSPISAAAVALAALATALLGWPRTRLGPWPQRLAAVLVLSMLVVLYGYLFNAPVLYHLPAYPSIALHTALALIALAVGLLMVTGNRGWVGELSLQSPASSAARRTLVLVIATVPLVALLRLLGQRLDLYDTEVGLALMCVTFTGAVTLLAWLTVRRANVDDRTISRLSRHYAMLSQTNQAIVRCPDEAALYRRLCEVAVEHGNYVFAWVARWDAGANETRLVAVAGAGVEGLGEGVTLLRERWPGRVVPTDRALRTTRGEAQPDDPPWIATARVAGLEVAAIPFACQGEVLGTLNLYSRDAADVESSTWPTLEEMGLDMSFALDNQAREQAREAAVAALSASEQRLQALTTEVPVGLYQVSIGPDGTQRFDYMSAPFCAMLGYDRDAIIADVDLPLQAVLPEDRAEVARLREVYRHGPGPVLSDLRFQVRGEIRHVRAIARHTGDEDGRRRWSGVVIDITEQVQAERERDRLRAQLVQAQRMEAIGQLTGGIAHDFNNILGSVLGFVTLALAREVHEPEGKLAQYLGEVQRGAERARDLVAKMLRFSRGGAPSEVAEPLEPVGALKDVLQLLRAVLPTSMSVRSQSDVGLPSIPVDAVEFHQMVMNLAINARDAMRGEGRLEFELHRVCHTDTVCAACGGDIVGEFVELGVQDDGPGIGDAAAADLFLPFYTTKPVDEGTGLGLAMVHGIVHRAGGHILLESSAATGTRFGLLFPAAGATATAAAGAERATERATVTGGHVMVVDDEASLTRLWQEVLEGAGYRVSCHADGAAALAAFEAAPEAVDAMILDMTMPLLSGEGLARAVLGRRPELPVFICTGYSDRLDALLAQSIGIRQVFIKPVDFERVLARLAEALEASRVA